MRPEINCNICVDSLYFLEVSRIMSRMFVRVNRIVKDNPSLLWKVPVYGSVAWGAGSWLGWSWLMGMSPVHVVEQSFRSFSTLYTVSNIAMDYKWSLRGYPNFIQQLEEATTDDEREKILLSQAEWEKKWDEVHERGAKKLLWVCQRNAGIFTKAGQHIASLNHILPAQYTTTLSVLQDKVTSI